jgi:drug/metabolite transporter (DMT)-like permease
MLGGMVLPSLLGIFFYEEKFTLAKALCFLFICIALALTVKRGEGKGGFFYCIGIFVLNGLSGVITKLFNELPFPRADAASYSMWGALWTVALSGALWLVLYLSKKKKGEEMPRYTLRACGVAAANGSLNKIANFILVLALVHVDASVQYPMVTGGVMVVSTLLCFFGERKPSKKELLSVVFAFLGTLFLFVIPLWVH